MARIAVDAMGGDHAPDEIVRGAAEVSLARSDVEIILCGDAERLGGLLADVRHDAERVRIHHAGQVIGMNERPADALLGKPKASIRVAARLVASGEADALVSAGNTGAAVLACQRHFRLIPGIRHAALGGVFPTAQRRGETGDPFCLILDVGATLDVQASDLVAFAVMGAAYAARISRNPRPRVALLSNGSAAGTGPREVVEAHATLLRLAGREVGFEFIGNVEAVDIPRGTADVVVCSGYVGNVVLKMLEGVSETVLNLARYASKERLLRRAALALLAGGTERLKQLTDWREYGGAPLLGFEQLLIKAHGRSRAREIANAIKVADKSIGTGLTRDLGAKLRIAGELAGTLGPRREPAVGGPGPAPPRAVDKGP